MFLGTVLTIVVIMGSVMYLVEGKEAGFDSIPVGIYWAIVTLTTVGYGDVYPVTTGGRVFTCFVLVTGLGIISVPAGLVASALSKAREMEDTDENDGSHVSASS